MADTDRIARLRISPAGIGPEIRRRVGAPLTASLKGVHGAIEAAMGRAGQHPFAVYVGRKVYGIPDPAWDFGRRVTNAAGVKLAALVARGIDRLGYVYDLGDDWRHTVTIEAVEPPAAARSCPRFVDGARRCPPEDVGGTDGHDEFLEAIGQPRRPEHRRMLEWYGGPYGPDDLDPPLIRRRIGVPAYRHAAGQAAYAKGGREGRRSSPPVGAEEAVAERPAHRHRIRARRSWIGQRAPAPRRPPCRKYSFLTARLI